MEQREINKDKERSEHLKYMRNKIPDSISLGLLQNKERKLVINEDDIALSQN